mgnify:FL=1
MQILDLLGSTASTAKVPQADLTSQKDAFAKHLNDVMSHRDAMRDDDARVHALKQDEQADARAEMPERQDRSDTEEQGEVADTEDAQETQTSENKSANSNDNNQAKETPGAAVAAAAKGLDMAQVLVTENHNPAAVQEVLESESGKETAIGLAANDVLEEVVSDEASGIVAALEMAHKAGQAASMNNAASANNSAKARGPKEVSEKTDVPGAAVAAGPVNLSAEAKTPEAVVAEVSEQAQEIAFKADLADPSEEAQVASQTVVQSNTPQIRNTVADAKDNKQVPGKDKIEQVTTESPLIKNAKIVVGPDTRLTDMQIAQALVEEAAADKIHARFMVAPAANSNAGAANQIAATQTSGAMEAGLQTAAQAGQNKQSGPVRMPDNEGLQQATQLVDCAEKAPKIPNQSAQPVQSPNALSNMDPTGQMSMSERAANTLAQLTAQTATGQGAARAAQAATPAAAAGIEAPGNAMGSSSAATPSAAIAEVGAPTNTQMANAAKPAAPPPPATPQPPQAQVAMHIAKAVQNGTDKISIRLNPSELGRVDIKLDVTKDGVVTASVLVERPETLELLKADARSLERALANAGLDPDSDNLSFNLRDQNNNSFAKNANGEENGSGKNQDENSSANADENEVDVEAMLAEARASASHDRALDINV